MFDRRLRNRLKTFRAERDLTQAQLAEMAGVSRKTIYTVENGVFTPSTNLALMLAEVLDCKVEDLFYLEPETPKLFR
jgi:putative transcriptional regulator